MASPVGRGAAVNNRRERAQRQVGYAEYSSHNCLCKLKPLRKRNCARCIRGCIHTGKDRSRPPSARLCGGSRPSVSVFFALASTRHWRWRPPSSGLQPGRVVTTRAASRRRWWFLLVLTALPGPLLRFWPASLLLRRPCLRHCSRDARRRVVDAACSPHPSRRLVTPPFSLPLPPPLAIVPSLGGGTAHRHGATMRAWLMDGDGAASPRAPHQRTPNVPVGEEELRRLGVLHWFVDPVEYMAGAWAASW